MGFSFIHLIRTYSNECFLMAYGVYVLRLPYPFICWWASRLLPCPGCDKQCCYEHWGARVSFRSGFLGVYAQKWDCWVRNFEDKLCSRWRTLKEAVLGREMLKFSTLNKLHILLWQFLRHLVKFKIVYVVQRINLMGLWALLRLCFFFNLLCIYSPWSRLFIFNSHVL